MGYYMNDIDRFPQIRIPKIHAIAWKILSMDDEHKRVRLPGYPYVFGTLRMNLWALLRMWDPQNLSAFDVKMVHDFNDLEGETSIFLTQIPALARTKPPSHVGKLIPAPLIGNTIGKSSFLQTTLTGVLVKIVCVDVTSLTVGILEPTRPSQQ